MYYFINYSVVRVKCRDLVQKIAVYKNKLAVWFSDSIIVQFVNTCTMEHVCNWSPELHVAIDCF